MYVFVEINTGVKIKSENQHKHYPILPQNENI